MCDPSETVGFLHFCSFPSELLLCQHLDDIGTLVYPTKYMVHHQILMVNPRYLSNDPNTLGAIFLSVRYRSTILSDKWKKASALCLRKRENFQNIKMKYDAFNTKHIFIIFFILATCLAPSWALLEYVEEKE